MKNESIDKIEKVVENILPTSSTFINELDYSVIEQKKSRLAQIVGTSA